MDGLKNRLMITSDPDHAHYGQHLTAEEAHAFVRPADATVQAVKAWFTEHGLEDHHVQFSEAQDWAVSPSIDLLFAICLTCMVVRSFASRVGQLHARH